MTLIIVQPFTAKIPLGRQGEDDAVRVQFDLSQWIAQYGKGTPALIHKRNGDMVSYPVELKVEGAVAYWDVQSVDTEKPGIGKCELSYHTENTTVKSPVYQTEVLKGMNSEVGYVPQEIPSWVDLVHKAVANANTAVENMDTAIEAAAQATERANKAAENVESGSVAEDEDVTEMLDEIFGDGSETEDGAASEEETSSEIL